MNIQTLVKQFIDLRDLKAQYDSAHKEQMRKITDKMDEIEAQILAHLDEIGGESIKTAAGTAYKQRRTNASVADWDAFLPFVIENELWNMLERRVSKAAVEEYRQENEDALPPGVNYGAEFVVNIRR